MFSHVLRPALRAFSIALLLLATPSIEVRHKKTTITTTSRDLDHDAIDKVVSEVAVGGRPVLLFTKLLECFILIVGSPGSTMSTTIFDDTFVFEQPLDSMKDNSLQLYAMHRVTMRWPQLAGLYINMFAVGQFIVLVGAICGVDVLNIITGVKRPMPLEKGGGYNLLKTSLQLSSNRAPAFYYINQKDKSFYTQMAFDHTDLTKANVIDSAVNRYLCNLGQNCIQFIFGECPNSSQPVTSWNIIAGGVYEFHNVTKFLLVEQGNSVIRFDVKGSFKFHDGNSTMKRFTAGHFWQRGTPKTTQTAGTIKASTVKRHHLLLLFIGIGVLILCVLIALLYYAYAIQLNAQSLKSLPPPAKSVSLVAKISKLSKAKRSKSSNKSSKKKKKKRSSTRLRTRHSKASKVKIKSDDRMPWLDRNNIAKLLVTERSKSGITMGVILRNPKKMNSSSLATKKRSVARRSSSRKRTSSKSTRKKRKHSKLRSRRTKN